MEFIAPIKTQPELSLKRAQIQAIDFSWRSFADNFRRILRRAAINSERVGRVASSICLIWRKSEKLRR